jgi:hypothetical protein
MVFCSPPGKKVIPDFSITETRKAAKKHLGDVCLMSFLV